MNDANSSSSYGTDSNVRSDTQGEFRLEKLPPGKYSISIYPPPESDLRAEPVTFDIVDQDVTGLLIKSSLGASFSGNVVLEGARDSNLVAALAQAYIGVNIRNDSSSMSSSQSARIRPDGSFRIGGLLPGTANFSLGASNNVKGLSISRVERNGVVQPNGIMIQNAEQVTGIRIFVAFNTGILRGVVKVENGLLPPSGRLIVQLTKPDGSLRGNYFFSEVDSRGHFLIEGLAAGNYEVIVMAYAPEWRRRPPIVKQIVTVTDGAATEIILTVDLASTANP